MLPPMTKIDTSVLICIQNAQRRRPNRENNAQHTSYGRRTMNPYHVAYCIETRRNQTTFGRALAGRSFRAVIDPRRLKIPPRFPPTPGQGYHNDGAATIIRDDPTVALDDHQITSIVQTCRDGRYVSHDSRVKIQSD